MTCFISYSRRDRRFCEQLHADLHQRSVRCWYFADDAPWGALLWKEVDRQIHAYDRLVVVCSKSSLQSTPVLHEIERALWIEDQGKGSVLFPICIDHYLEKHWTHPRKADVLARVAGNFEGWNRRPGAYEQGLHGLLEALPRRE